MLSAEKYLDPVSQPSRRAFLRLTASAAALALIQPGVAHADSLNEPGFFHQFLEAVLVQNGRLSIAPDEFNLTADVARFNAFVSNEPEQRDPHRLIPGSGIRAETAVNPLIVKGIPGGPFMVYDSGEFGQFVSVPLTPEVQAGLVADKHRQALIRQKLVYSSRDLFETVDMRVANKVVPVGLFAGSSRVLARSNTDARLSVMYSRVVA